MMAAPRALVLRAAGTNCDRETAAALALAGARPDRVHLNVLRDRAEPLAGYEILALPGGFSYGDDLGAGRVLASELRHYLAVPSYLREAISAYALGQPETRGVR